MTTEATDEDRAREWFALSDRFCRRARAPAGYHTVIYNTGFVTFDGITEYVREADGTITTRNIE